MKRVLYSALVVGLLVGNAQCSMVDKKKAEEESELEISKFDNYGGVTHVVPVVSATLVLNGQAYGSVQTPDSPRTTIRAVQQDASGLGTPHDSQYGTPEEGAPLHPVHKQTSSLVPAPLAAAVQPVVASGVSSAHSTAPIKHRRAKSAPVHLDKKGNSNEVKPATRQIHAKSADEKTQEKTQE